MQSDLHIWHVVCSSLYVCKRTHTFWAAFTCSCFSCKFGRTPSILSSRGTWGRIRMLRTLLRTFLSPRSNKKLRITEREQTLSYRLQLVLLPHRALPYLPASAHKSLARSLSVSCSFLKHISSRSASSRDIHRAALEGSQHFDGKADTYTLDAPRATRSLSYLVTVTAIAAATSSAPGINRDLGASRLDENNIREAASTALSLEDALHALAEENSNEVDVGCL